WWHRQFPAAAIARGVAGIREDAGARAAAPVQRADADAYQRRARGLRAARADGVLHGTFLFASAGTSGGGAQIRSARCRIRADRRRPRARRVDSGGRRDRRARAAAGAAARGVPRAARALLSVLLR